MGGCGCKGTCTQPVSPRISRQREIASTGPNKVSDAECGTEDTPEEPQCALGEPLLEKPPSSTILKRRSNQEFQKKRKKTPIVKYALALIFVALLGGVVYVQWAKIKSYVAAVWLGLLHLGFWAVPIWVVLLWAVTSVSGPAFIFELNGGVLFAQLYGPTKGAIVGMLTCSLGIWLGCVTAFAIGRRFFKHYVEEIIKENRTLSIINEIVTEEGWKFSFLMRLNPMIPFEIFNYAVAMSDITFWENAVAAIGTLPRVCFEVYLAVAASDVVEDTEEGGPQRNDKIIHVAINLGIGLVLIAATAIYGKRKYDAKVGMEAQSVIRILSTTSELPGKLRNNIGQHVSRQLSIH